MSERKAGMYDEVIRRYDEKIALIGRMQTIDAQLQAMMGSDNSYRDITRALDEAMDTARSVRELHVNNAREAAEAERGRREGLTDWWSDTRPLTAKGAHSVYNGR